MAKELGLRSSTRGVLVPTKLAQALDTAAKQSPSAPRGRMRGQELRLARSLDLDDAACAGFVLAFVGQGVSVTGTAYGPSAVLLEWALHAIASVLRCELLEDDAPISAAPDVRRAAAIAYLDGYEAEVRAARREAGEIDGGAFVKWLAREEQIALTPNASFEELPMDDPERLYEHLLESEGVEEVFVSERELVRLQLRFVARRPTK